MPNRIVKPLLLVALVLVLPLVLLAFAGESFANVQERWKAAPPTPAVLFVAVAAILATDIFLPVPSGPISTLAGSQLGIVAGTLASAIGMTLGGTIAFALARRWGRPLAERLSSGQSLTDLESIANSYGVLLLLVTRALPVLAEAAVLLLGTLQMKWRIFLPTLVVSNLVIAACYATLGSTASEHDWLPIAVCLSMAVPFCFALMIKHRFSRIPTIEEELRS
jgi:uncharacterized membrane protein YdjX (TVP38/TMEM64 family)